MRLSEGTMSKMLLESSGRRGRPSFDIREEQVSFLVEKGFQVPTIAKPLRVSIWTVERRMAQYCLSISGAKF